MRLTVSFISVSESPSYTASVSDSASFLEDCQCLRVSWKLYGVLLWFISFAFKDCQHILSLSQGQLKKSFSRTVCLCHGKQERWLVFSHEHLTHCFSLCHKESTHCLVSYHGQLTHSLSLCDGQMTHILVFIKGHLIHSLYLCHGQSIHNLVFTKEQLIYCLRISHRQLKHCLVLSLSWADDTLSFLKGS